MFDIAIAKKHHPNVSDFTALLILAGLYEMRDLLEKIMADQDTVNELAGTLSGAATTLTTVVPELQNALNGAPPTPIDFTALQTAVQQISDGVTALANLVPAPTPPAA